MNILLAEDDAFFQKFYALKLKDQGFLVTAASDGEEAISYIVKQPFDIILLDIIMPKKTGFEVLEHLKNNAVPHAPILVFSTLGQEQDVQKALSLGASGYVNKTFFDFSNLLIKMNELVSSSQKPV